MFLFFDVESVGLFGEGFAVGWALYDAAGREVSAGYAGCPSEAATGDDDGRAWIRANVEPRLPPPTCAAPRAVREAFWTAWLEARERGASLVADVGWPVEANFLIACVADAPGARRWAGPYPLLDVSSVRVALGLDPLGDDVPRAPVDGVGHNPVHDARRSAHLFFEALGHRSHRGGG